MPDVQSTDQVQSADEIEAFRPREARQALLPAWARHRHPLTGAWRSLKLDYGDFPEWKGTAKIDLVVYPAGDVDLFLITKAGTRRRAGDSWPGSVGKNSFVFGSLGSALIFRYRREGKGLILDMPAKSDGSEGSPIHAVLRRVHATSRSGVPPQ